MAERKRDYGREYATFHGTEAQKKNRAQRNAARREMEKRHGPLPATTEVDHRVSIKHGGTNTPSNLRLVSRNANRRKGAKGG